MLRKRLPSLPLMVGLCGVITLSLFAFWVAQQLTQTHWKKEFERESSKAELSIQRALDRNIQSLKSIVALYKASEQVERQEFQQFVQVRLLDNSAIQALEWIPRVPSTQREIYEQAARQNGFPDFQFTEHNQQGQIVRASQRPEYFPVYYVEPLRGNETALGFDLASNPTRLKTMNQARDQNQAVASTPIDLVQGTDNTEKGILVFLPIFLQNQPINSISARRQNLEGFALSVFQIENLMNSILDITHPRGFDFYLFDQSLPQGEQLVYTASSIQGKSFGNLKEDTISVLQKGIYYTTTLDIAERQWLLIAKPNADSIALQSSSYPWMILAIGGVLVVGLIVYNKDQQRVKSQLQQTKDSLAHQVQERTAALQHSNQQLMQQMKEHQQTEVALQKSQERYMLAMKGSQDGFWDWDVLTNEVYYTPRFKELLGYQDHEMKNQFSSFESRLHPDDHDWVLAAVHDHLEHQIPYEVEYRLRTKQEDYLWIYARGQAIWNESGQATRMAGSISDITKRKQSEDQIREITQRLALATDSAKIGVWDLDLVEDRLIWDDRMYELYGIKAEEFGGAYEAWKQGVHPEDLAAADADIQAAIAGEKEFHPEFRVMWPDGQVRFIEAHAIVLRDAIGQAQRMIGVNWDITERKQIEQALAQKVKQQATVAQLGQLALASQNLDQLMDKMVVAIATNLDVEYCKILKLLPDEKSLLLKKGVGWHPGLVGQAVIGTDDDSQAGYTLKSSKPVIVENLQTDSRFNGPALLRNHQVMSGMSVIIGRRHKPYGIIGAHTTEHRVFTLNDVDFLQSIANLLAQAVERRQAESTVKKSEARFRALVTSAPVGIFQANSQGECQFVNARWQNMTGLTADEAMGTGWSQALHPEDRERVWSEWSQATEFGKEFESEYRFLTPQEKVVWVYGRAISLRDDTGTVTGYLRTVTDISARKQAQQKVREQAALLDIATDAILVRAMDGRILFWNKGATTLYGWTEAEAFGRDANQLLYVEASDGEEEIQRDLMHQGNWMGERRQVTKAGQEIIVMSRWTLVMDEQDNPKYILTVNTDITQQKQLESQFLRAQRLESVGTLASGIAHDLNNILTPIYGVAQLLPLQLPDADAQIQHEFEIIQTSAKRGTDIVQQVLSFSRGVEGDRTPLNIKHLISEIRIFVHRTFPKFLEMSVDMADDLWSVKGDATQLHQVFMNLFINARDAMPEGGTLTVSSKNLSMDQALAAGHINAKEGAYIIVTVADTGIGIPVDQQERIFEPFFSTKQATGGTGLGLATVYRIIQNHGGFITVDSRVDQGTQFKIYLPAIEAAEANEEDVLNVPLGQGELILLVDDEAPIREVARSILEQYNYRVLVAVDGVDAIAKYAEHKADIKMVLMDMEMPILNGAKAIQRMQKINPHLSVIIVSASQIDGHSLGTISECVKGFPDSNVF